VGREKVKSVNKCKQTPGSNSGQIGDLDTQKSNNIARGKECGADCRTSAIRSNPSSFCAVPKSRKVRNERRKKYIPL
jgi:hypothetical protein